MKRIAVALLGAAFCALAAGVSSAGAASMYTLTPASAPDRHGALYVAAVSDTVGVQLVVIGAVFFVVVIVGLTAYTVRKRLGLVPPPPDQPAGNH